MKDQSLICFMSTSAFMYKPDKSVLIWCIKFNLHWSYYKSKWKEANKLNRHKTGCGISMLRWHIIRSKGNPGYCEISRYDTETQTGACCKQWNTLNTRTFYGWTPHFTTPEHFMVELHTLQVSTPELFWDWALFRQG